MRAAIRRVADAVGRRTAAAADARWCVIGVVTAFSANKITATIDGSSITGIRRGDIPWPLPAAGDVGLFAVVRGTKSVQYVGICKITP